jgi:hypothetical protein
MVPANGQWLFFTHLVTIIPALAFLVVGVLFLINRRSGLSWLLMVSGALIVQANSWIGFYSGWAKTEAAAQEGVRSLELAIAGSIQHGFYHSLVGLGGWTLIVLSVVLLALGRANGTVRSTSVPRQAPKQ